MSIAVSVIFNPAAGQGDPEQERQVIQQQLADQMDIQVVWTTPEKSAKQLAQTAVSEGARLVVAAGGDGTVAAVASALIHTGIPLGVIGRGTANAFANALGIPTTLEAACQVILDQHTRVVDAAQCNDEIMILLTGIGLGAEIIRQADRATKDRLGVLAYILAGIEQFQNLELFTAELDIEGEAGDSRKIEVSAGAITVANAAPATSILAQGPAGVIPDDGLLDVTIMAPTTTLDALAASYDLLRSALQNRAATQKSVGYLRTKRLTITATPKQRVMTDGELMGQTPMTVHCLPKALTVLTPQPEDLRSQHPQEKLTGLPGLKIHET